MTPPVRGRQRIAVTAIFAASATATGALAGLVAGALWALAATVAPAGFDRGLGPVVAAAVVATAGLVDLAAARWKRLSPVCVPRQVPQAWGRLFAPATVAFLYGSRLGVGPATILSTWLWWAALLVAASHGAGWAALAGAIFGLVRIAAVVVASRWDESDMPGRIARLAAADLRARGAASLLALVVAAVAVTGALSTADRREGTRPRATAGNAEVGDDRTGRADARSGRRTDRDGPQPAQPVEADPRLAALLVDDLGEPWERIPDSRAATIGPLDLAAAAAAERDVHAERALLETRRFRLGHARAWRGAGDLVAYAAVYEFGSPADAAAYVVDGRITLEGRGANVYPLAEPSGALGFSEATESRSGTSIAHGVVFSRGSHFFLVVVTGSRATAEDARIAALAQDTKAVSVENL